MHAGIANPRRRVKRSRHPRRMRNPQFYVSYMVTCPTDCGLFWQAVDVGGSMFVHVFGAYFGIAMGAVMAKNDDVEEQDHKAGPVYHSELFSMIGECHEGVKTLLWRHNACDAVSNHRRVDCLLNLLFRRRSKNTSKLRVAGLLKGSPTVTGAFPLQRTSNAEMFSFNNVFMI